MRLQALPADERAVERYVEELWLPFHRELATIVDDHVLAEDVAIVEEETAFRLDLLREDDYRLLVAVDDVANDVDDDGEVDVEDEALDISAGDGTLVGFVATSLDEASTVFDRPDRLTIGDIYVDEAHRGTGLARTLVDRAVARARELDCEELALDVDVENDRALAFYEKLGFEPHRYRMTVPVDRL